MQSGSISDMSESAIQALTAENTYTVFGCRKRDKEREILIFIIVKLTLGERKESKLCDLKQV